MTDDQRWQATLNRDPASDGAFVYAVTTTGIYCRPICPSRRPRRENARFFDLPGAAEAAGFRACKRCRPEAAEIQDPQVRAVQQVCEMIEAEMADGEEGLPTLNRLAVEVGLSPHHLQRTFKRLMGISPRDYADARRLDRFKQGLKSGVGIAEATYDAGYGSSSRVYEKSNGRLGMTPATYAKGGRDMRIAYTVADCRLGKLLVAATERGVSAVYLGADPAEMVAALEAEYPRAEIREDGSALGRWVTALVGFLDADGPHPDLPLDLRATAFQRRVWQELTRIPYGETRSYGEIAAALGQPKAVRAVARACATNPVSMAIPCHRVIGADGGLRGYRWGVERKEALLEMEAKGAKAAVKDVA